MTRTARRWYPVFIMRDVLGRFARLRVQLAPTGRPRRVRRPARPAVLQLVLF